METRTIIELEQKEYDARAALRAMGAKVLALSEGSGGELAVEARRALMLARMPLDSPASVERALELAGGCASFVDNWGDCARHGRESPEEASRRFSEASGSCRLLAAAFADRKAKAASHVGLSLLAAAHILDDHAQELGAKEESERDRLDREFDEGLLDPAREASAMAVSALCALADALIAGAEGGDGG
jgi:hypothetical protein